MIRDNFGYVSFDSLKEQFGAAGYHISSDSTKCGFVAFRKKNDRLKIVSCIISGAYNIRDAKQAKAHAYKMACSLIPHIDFSEKDILTLVYDDKHGNHYFAKDVIYFNERLGSITNLHSANSFADEVEIIKDASKYKKAVKNSYNYAHPEGFHYVPLALMLTVIATLMAYIFTLDANLFGYSASTVFTGEPYRLITYMFAHGSIRHLLGNVISIMILGSVINKYEGNIHFLIIYLGGGILGAIFNSLYVIATGNGINTMIVGASGAVFALLGAMLVETFFNYDMEANRGNVILYIIIVMVSSNIGGNISIGTHIFGFIAGIILGIICCKETKRRHEASLKKFSARKDYYDEKYKTSNTSYAGPTGISRV